MKKALIIRKGYCLCGCGGKVNTMKVTNTLRGYKKGDYLKYISGHNIKGEFRENTRNWRGGMIQRGIYMCVHCPTHPKAQALGYVPEHVLIVEKLLGKYLPKSAVVHHINGDGTDNSHSNLVVCQDHSYHMRLHRRARAFYASGHAGWFKCSICHKYDDPKNLCLSKRYDGGRHKKKCI